MNELVRSKIATGDLQLGMHVVELDRPWLETSFLIQGFTIQDQDDIDALVEQCSFVFVEGSVTTTQVPPKIKQNINPSKKTVSASKKTRKRDDGPPHKSKKIKYINKIPFEKEATNAKQTYKSAKSIATDIIDGIRIGRAIDMHQAKQAVNEVVDSILRNNDALMWLSKIKNKDDYTAEHSLNVCILSVTFSRFLGHNEADIRRIGLGGLLHDVGKSKIPNEVLNKPGRYSKEEFELMKGHPVFGRNLLMSIANADRSAVDVAYSHHERIDGKGYPRGLAEHQISYYAKIVALADTYDAITSNRCYDKGRASMEALDIIYRNKGTQFDEELALEFIKCIGVYPPGSIVEMTNGEIGIIIEENRESKLRPRVILVKGQDQNWCDQRIINLQLKDLDHTGEPYIIAHEIPDGSHGIYIKEFLERGLVLKHGT